MPRKIIPADYATLAKWWTAQNFPTIAPEYLPQCGLIVDGLCAGFLYESDSAIAWVEWIVANPEAEKALRREALDKLLDALVLHAKERGYKAIFTSVAHPGLLERYKQHGFVVTDNGVTHLLRSI